MWFSLCGPLVWILIVIHNLSVLGVLLFFVISSSCFLKSYFVFSLWSGYNTIIWWFFIYLFIISHEYGIRFQKNFYDFRRFCVYIKSSTYHLLYRVYHECKFSVLLFVYYFMFYWSLFTMCIVIFHFKL